MRTSRFTSTALVAAFALIALAPLPAPAQQPGAADKHDQAAPPKPYKPVAIKLPQEVKDQSFQTFRKQLATIAQKKDRAALARIIAQNFFWVPDDKDVADKRKSGIDNLSKAIGLEGRDPAGWEILAGFASETTADPSPDHKGAICAPGEPAFDEKAAEELANATQTDPGEWAYPASNGIEVRSGQERTAPVIERLGLYLVRVYPEDSPAAAVQGGDMLRIVTPSGKLGYVPSDALLPLSGDQICYVKEGNAWKIVGVIGGAGTPGQ